jgi:SusD family.
MDAGNKTRLSKTVARTLLTKVYAEKPLRDYAKVIQYADQVAADGCELTPDYTNLFGMNEANTDTKMRNTIESILEIQYTPGNGNWATWMFGRDLINWNSNFSWTKWVTPSRDLIALFNSEGDQIRFKESIVYYKCDWSNYYPKDNYPFMYKLRSAYSSIIKYRYADVLLLKAEALILKDSPDLNAAANIIDQVRQRVGLAKLPTATKSNKTAMEEALLKERRLEMAYEGQRWFDLVRLNKVESVMNAVYGKDSGRRAMRYAFGPDSYRLPIPQAAMDQNPNLVQKPRLLIYDEKNS